MRNYYEVLGLPLESGPEEIKKAYHQLAMQYHPDKNKSADAAEKMRRINEAYQTLSDPEEKARYDSMLMQHRPGTPWPEDYQSYARTQKRAGRNYAHTQWRPSQVNWQGYEAPRDSARFEYSAVFSMENLFHSVIVGLAFGMIVAAGFVFMSVTPGVKGNLASISILIAAAVSVPPFFAVIERRNSVASDSEAGIVGSIALAITLMIAVVTYTFVSAIFYPGGSIGLVCCGLTPALGIAGWVIGGWIGKLTRTALHI